MQGEGKASYGGEIIGGGSILAGGEGEGAVDEHFICSGITSGGPEVQGLGKGLLGLLTRNVLGGLHFLFTPWAKPGF